MDIIRKTIRSVIRSDSQLYLRGANFLNFFATVKNDGLKTWQILQKLQKSDDFKGNPFPVKLNNLLFPFLIRPATLDAETLINNVIREEYGYLNLVIEPLWMIDAGAYIGDTSAYFLSRFPKLKVIALEPNPESFSMAKQNLDPYGDRIVLLKKGLYSENQNQYFTGESTGASISSQGFEIECTTIVSLMERYSINHLDILKMDIEGAEEAIFLKNPEQWLNRIDMLIIEIHGKKIEVLISKVLKEFGFSMKKYRSIWYCTPNRK